MFDMALGIFLFLSPIIILLGWNAKLNGTILALQFHQFNSISMDMNITQFQFFQYGIILLFIIALAQKPIRDFKDKYLAWFLGLCALSVYFHPKTISAFIPIILGVLLYYLVVKYTKNVKKITYVIILISALNTIFAVLQFFKINLIYTNLWGISGLMCQTSQLGTYQALAFPICYMVNPILSIIPLIGLLLSKSYTPIIATLIGMIYLRYPQRKNIFINLAPMGIIMVLGIFLVALIRNYNELIYKFSLRAGLWIATLKAILERPFIGYGLGTFNSLSDRFYTRQGHWELNHNEYLGIAFSVGLLSLFFIWKFLIDKFKGIETNLIRAFATSCLIISVICLGQSAMHFARLAGTIIPLFAFLEILKRRESCV